MIKFLRWLPKLKNPKFEKYLVLIALLAICCLLFTHLGRDPLFDWDESIYGELGRELLKTGNLWTNFWNGSTWFEKPPGISWASALGLSMFNTEFGARLFMPIFGAMTLGAVYLIGKKLKNWQLGAGASGILATFNLFLDRTRALNTDMPLLLGITIGLVALLYSAPAWVYALTIAFSVWFKGLAGLMAVFISFPLLLTKTRNYTLKAISYTLIMIIPWHLYSYLKYGIEFLKPYLLEQVISRAVNPIEFHLESRYYYFNFLYTNLGVGVLFVALVGIIMILHKIVKKNNHVFQLETFNFNLFTLLWWLVVPLVIFTLAKTRLFWYILPVYPAIALLCSYAITAFATSKKSRVVVNILVIGIILQGLWSAYRYTDPHRTQPTGNDTLQVVKSLRPYNQKPLAVLVSSSERTAEAILPKSQRISSSFRYGGAPSIVYYYGGEVKYFYNTDDFGSFVISHPSSPLMLTQGDSSLVPGANIMIATQSIIGIGPKEK